MLGFFLLGLIPALNVLWDLSLLAFAATAGYLALLIHIHRRSVEREVKIIDIQDRLWPASFPYPLTPSSRCTKTIRPATRWSDDELAPNLGSTTTK